MMRAPATMLVDHHGRPVTTPSYAAAFINTALIDAGFVIAAFIISSAFISWADRGPAR